ncbi:helix-turn-helix domain-containing protein [Mammaliicoccus sciuri]|uniref:XRE family transcriptional regulator n=1 Tax=Mammaliicoccus sciuri TaxID=1296 RepID=A0AAI8DKF9_MAMSC|nr:helix-turn-helix transcriptional regulator [Mammaliicoccus sciuri]ASE35358.1 XRE family transcriptional regulator [Mammaliicoccus sciuri]
MYDKKKIGKRIKEIRVKNGKTQEKFGEMFSASKGNVATWEKGLSLPNNERLKMISQYAGISVSELLYNNKDNIEEFEEEIFKDMLKIYTDDTHIGKSLRFPNNDQKKELLRSGINRTLSVPMLKKKIDTPKSILKEKIYYYITDDFLDFYVKNKKSNHNIITYLENDLNTLYSYLNEYNFYDFNYQLNGIIDDVTLIFDERDSGVNTNLLNDLEKLIEDILNKLKNLKQIYPDEKSKRYIDVTAVIESEIRIYSQYSFEIDSDIDKIEFIEKNLSKIIKELDKNKNELQRSLVNKDKQINDTFRNS